MPLLLCRRHNAHHHPRGSSFPTHRRLGSHSLLRPSLLFLYVTLGVPPLFRTVRPTLTPLRLPSLLLAPPPLTRLLPLRPPPASARPLLSTTAPTLSHSSYVSFSTSPLVIPPPSTSDSLPFLPSGYDPEPSLPFLLFSSPPPFFPLSLSIPLTLSLYSEDFPPSFETSPFPSAPISLGPSFSGLSPSSRPSPQTPRDPSSYLDSRRT